MGARLIFWLILLLLGALVGHRYGMPGMVTNITDQGFEKVEGLLGNAGVTDAASDDEADDADETVSNDEQSTQTYAAADDLRINDAGLQIIKDSEGLRLEAYSAGSQWLIGYGHTRTAHAGMTITEAQAEQLLREDVQDAENSVRQRVSVPVNENQFSALVSLSYNLGSGNFSRSSVLDALNAGDYAGAADNFLNHNLAGGQVNEHLTHRREKERALFNTPV